MQKQLPTPPGSLVGILQTPVGVGVPLIQSGALVSEEAALVTMNRQSATVCGNLLFRDGQLALDVLYVTPGTNATTPGVSPLALTVLALMGLLPVS